MAKKHVHKYVKRQIGTQRLWSCALPDCSHYIPKHMEEMIEGKYSRCWGCEDLVILDAVNMKRDKPLCDACSAEFLMRSHTDAPEIIHATDPGSQTQEEPQMELTEAQKKFKQELIDDVKRVKGIK